MEDAFSQKAQYNKEWLCWCFLQALKKVALSLDKQELILNDMENETMLPDPFFALGQCPAFHRCQRKK